MCTYIYIHIYIYISKNHSKIDKSSRTLLTHPSSVVCIYNLFVVKGFRDSRNKSFPTSFKGMEFLEILDLMIILKCFDLIWVLRRLGCCDLGNNEREKAARGSSFSISWVLGSLRMELRFLVPGSRSFFVVLSVFV